MLNYKITLYIPNDRPSSFNGLGSFNGFGSFNRLKKILVKNILKSKKENKK
tara:strand:- start:536 stop:688 length:153 start_codon:yes stop_codon:yes gene_type:complete